MQLRQRLNTLRYKAQVWLSFALIVFVTLAAPAMVQAQMSWDDVNSIIKDRADYKRQCGTAPATTNGGAASGNTYVLGDSISYGLHLAGIEGKLSAQLGGTAKVNYDGGRSITGPGSQEGVSPHMSALQAADADKDVIGNADVVIVVLGTNMTDDPFEENLKQLMTKLKGYAKPNTTFYWVDIGANAPGQAAGWSRRNQIIYDNSGSQGYTVISRYKAIFGADKDPRNINGSLSFPGGGDQIHGAYTQLVDEIMKVLSGSGAAPVTFESLNRYQALKNTLASIPSKPKNFFSRVKDRFVAMVSPTVNAQTNETPTNGQETMTLRDKIAQMLLVRVDTSAQANAATIANVGGVYVREESPPDHPSSYLDSEKLRDMSTRFKTPPIISTDGEGGRVDSLGKKGIITPLPSAKNQGTQNDEEVTRLATDYSRKMSEIGITMDFAPVLDLDNPNNSIIGGLERSYSNDPAVVTAKATAFAKGLAANNVVPVYKHFPGHGNADGDSHQGAVTTPPLDQLRQHDLKPYETIAPTAKAIMMGHLNVPGLGDENLPASINPEAIKLLRTDYKFNGVVMTDDITGMKAITDLGLSQEQALEKAILAGNDMLVTNTGIDLPAVLTYLEQKANENPELTKRIDESSARILKLKGEQIGPKLNVDSCSCGTATVGASTLQGSDTAEQIFNFFLGQFPGKPWIGAGFMGNMMAESGLNPRALEPGTTGDAPIRGKGYGLIQWTFAERQVPLEQQAAAKGKPVSDLLVQLEYIMWELDNDQGTHWNNVREDLEAIAGGDDAVEKATLIIEDRYEVHAGGRQPKRIADAKGFFLKYGGNVAVASASGSARCGTNANGQIVGGYSLPLDKKWYDEHKEWFTNPHHDYPAADIPIPTGTPVYSMTAGTITQAPNGSLGQNGGYGLGVTVRTAEGVDFYYGHGSDGGSVEGAKQGDTVRPGQLIMNSASTGSSTGPHLHLEIRYKGQILCPQPLFVAIAEGSSIPSIDSLPNSGCTF